RSGLHGGGTLMSEYRRYGPGRGPGPGRDDDGDVDDGEPTAGTRAVEHSAAVAVTGGAADTGEAAATEPDTGGMATAAPQTTGAATGRADTGGAPTGGVPTGGMPTGGMDTGGMATGAMETADDPDSQTRSVPLSPPPPAAATRADRAGAACGSPPPPRTGRVRRPRCACTCRTSSPSIPPRRCPIATTSRPSATRPTGACPAPSCSPGTWWPTSTRSAAR